MYRWSSLSANLMECDEPPATWRVTTTPPCKFNFNFKFTLILKLGMSATSMSTLVLAPAALLTYYYPPCKFKFKLKYVAIP
jgi:hypothetical protein